MNSYHCSFCGFDDENDLSVEAFMTTAPQLSSSIRGGG